MKTYKYRIYPNKEQQNKLAQHFGCARYVYNQALSYKSRVYKESKKNINYFDLQNEWLKRQKQENIWLKDVTAQSLQMVLRNLDNAYTKFFHKKAKFPKFKKKSNRQSCQFAQSVKAIFDSNLVQLPKIGKVKAVLHRRFLGKIKVTTVILSPSGKYYVCICVDENVKIQTESKHEIGIDLGIISFATTSDGKKYEAPKPLKKYLSQLQRLQSILSKKVKGSSNYKKLSKKIARLHEKITNIRTDFLHKLSTKLCRENQTICVEKLNVKGMLENAPHSNLARTISDVSWSKFLEFLKYKCKDLRESGKFDPTTKLCSNCGIVEEGLTLSDRIWECQNCKASHDRDVNAAINVKYFGLERSNTPD